MITIYYREKERLETVEGIPGEALPPATLWVDACQPDEREHAWLQKLFDKELPTAEDLDEIESSSRFQVDSDGVRVTSLFPHRQKREARGINISFHLSETLLVTLRNEETGMLRLLRNHLRRQRLRPTHPWEIFLALMEMKVDYLADQVEDIYATLERIAHQAMTPEALEDTLRDLLTQEGYNDIVRLALLDTQRALRNMMRHAGDREEGQRRRDRITDMLRDIDSLHPHTAFIFEKIKFLLDVAMGFTNMDQSRIIKIFSVAAVVFMPPTLIASIYGMNFQFMPELNLELGYPMALVMMCVSALGTYLFFRWKKWL
ncbi:magnesium/cobalt transporter CorA [Larsenimonas rhizosphaerae]|uniref:Magnesium transport protein CorA n=1 Tax=Larsenimonas rhizosphaerae TaxID=2944682 RepID=A0AA41ZGB0_9GAMM|nr:magnesium/cobalt transporter CorA [Larsenimonas rhizosphaerae]MCM2130664.1 magnesium/cobalt transporter CorA [Larsenimonas rhizosphaerae]MCX2523368.1 magnesium/cobalt transporter CorA [Larsenimonas rhizosphaerae]